MGRRHQVRLLFKPPNSTTVVVLPEGELKQILFNLIRNAIQASCGGQTVTIKVDSTVTDHAQILIIDQVRGIAEDMLPHIFEPFFSTKAMFPGVIGASPPMLEVLEIIDRISATDTNILITGERGTGKEVIAKAIHSHSQRRAGAFQISDCTTIPELLLIEVTSGRFRQDLFYRLGVIHIELPPLRNRGDDVLLLAEDFLKSGAANKATSKRFSAATLDCLRNYHWPGNIRELRNPIERTVAFCDGNLIQPSDLPETVRHCLETPRGPAGGVD
ncbi:sigma 54-interacting transcriptional regulator [Planctomycetaceae bacterium SH139]